MKLHQNFFRAFAIAGLSLSIATAQSTGTSGNTGSSAGAGQSQSGATGTGSAGQSDRQSGATSGTAAGQSGVTGTGAGTQSGAAGQHSGHVAGAAGNNQSGSGDMIGKNDRQFMTKAAQSGMMEIQLAQMAQQKAASDDVKAYARKLEQDHSKANDQLKKIAQERGVDLPSDMGQHQQQMAKFQNLSGEEFDRQYMRMQVQHHKKDISEFKKHQNRSMDSDLKEFASAQLPVLQQHYEQAQQLSASTGTRARKADKNNSGTTDQGSGSTGASGNTGSGNTGSRTGDTGSGSSSGNTGSGSSTGKQEPGSRNQ